MDHPQFSIMQKNAEFTPEENKLIKLEIEKLLLKGIIMETYHEDKEFVSQIFITYKSDGGVRLILNLKKLNKHVKYEHFKMATIRTVLNMVNKNCFMASIDLKDAYYSVKIHDHFQRYLKFGYNQKLYKFICFPNGLGPCPRKFTKITKVPTSELRLSLTPVCGYIDDFITKASSFDMCVKNTEKIITIFQNLGFVIHSNKSQFIPSQEIKFLGFVINSKNMTVALTASKEKNLKLLVSQLLSMKYPTIRFLAKIIGTLVSSFPAVKFGPLYYRSLEKVKVGALKQNNGNFEANCTISKLAHNELLWWKNNTAMINWIHPPSIELEIFCDASSTAWGAICGVNKTGAAWNISEQALHINVLELLAIFYALRSFKEHCKGKHIKIYSDNTAAVGITNKMGTTRSSQCDNVAKNIWKFCHTNMGNSSTHSWLR